MTKDEERRLEAKRRFEADVKKAKPSRHYCESHFRETVTLHPTKGWSFKVYYDDK